MEFNFKSKHSFDKRIKESNRIKSQYPDKIPIIIERHSKCTNLPKLDKSKYLIPEDLNFGQLIFVIRRRLQISKEKAIFIFHGNVIPPTSANIGLYFNNKIHDDGFVYLTYSGENAFGS